MGHNTHLRKLFEKSINTYDYHNVDLGKKKPLIIYFMRIGWLFIWTNFNPLYPRKSSIGPLAQGAKNQVDVNVNNEQINIEYHTLFLIPDQGMALKRWYRPESVGRGLRPLEGQSQVRDQMYRVLCCYIPYAYMYNNKIVWI